MALADLNPRSTSKYLIAADLTNQSGRLLTIDVAASSSMPTTCDACTMLTDGGSGKLLRIGG